MEGRISKAMNQKEKNVFEGPKKKPANAAQKERKKGLQVRYTRLPELDRLSERFSLPHPTPAPILTCQMQWIAGYLKHFGEFKI